MLDTVSPLAGHATALGTPKLGFARFGNPTPLGTPKLSHIPLWGDGDRTEGVVVGAPSAHEPHADSRLPPLSSDKRMTSPPKGGRCICHSLPRRRFATPRGQCVDESGNPVGFTRRVNGTPYNYYYVTNLQGDVIRILDANYNTVCNYYYDAWGAIRKITDGSGTDITNSTNQYSIAYLNPIRYRGYYYDVETGFYYLQTRYYDPVIGRFISRDSYEYIGANGDLGSYNLFAYCSNNPVKCIDSSGEFALLTAAIVIAQAC